MSRSLGGLLQRLQLCLREREGDRQGAEGVGPRPTARTLLERTDRRRAQPRSVGQRLLTEARAQSKAFEQRADRGRVVTAWTGFHRRSVEP